MCGYEGLHVHALSPSPQRCCFIGCEEKLWHQGPANESATFLTGTFEFIGLLTTEDPLLRRLPVPGLRRSQHSSICCHGSPCTCAQRRIFSLCLICALTLFGHPPTIRHYPGFNLSVCQCRCGSRLEATSWTGTAGSDGLTQWPREHQSDELITTQHMTSLKVMWQQSTVSPKSVTRNPVVIITSWTRHNMYSVNDSTVHLHFIKLLRHLLLGCIHSVSAV